MSRQWTSVCCMSVALANTFCNVGCVTSQLRYRVTRQAASIPDIYYQEVLNNLAMIQADPSRMPYFSDPQTSRSRVQQSSNANYGLNLDLITTAPTGVLTLFNRYLLDRQSGGVGESRGITGEWTALTANDPDKLFAMRAAYHRAIGVENAEDKEILSEFYYRHFEITNDTLANLQRELPDIYERIASKLTKVKDIEYLTVESFEGRLKADDLLGRDEFERFRRPLLKYSRMLHEPSEFLSDSDTHHLLYATALPPGWFGVGKKHDIPKTAYYVGQYGKSYIWVTSDNTETLTRLALAILDIHTFRSERVGGLRVQPGILPR